MKVLGFKLSASDMYCALLEGDNNVQTILTKECIHFPINLDTPAFTNWAETQFGLLIDRHEPDKIVYKLSTGFERHDQILRAYFGLGMLNYVAFNKSKQIRHIAPQSLRPTNFGLDKTEKIDNYIKDIFPNEENPWNKNIREVVSCILLEYK